MQGAACRTTLRHEQQFDIQSVLPTHPSFFLLYDRASLACLIQVSYRVIYGDLY